MAIHHATIKRAAKFGVTIEEVGGKFRLTRIEDGAMSADSFESTGEAMESIERKEVEFVTEAKISKSNHCGVMVKTYHDRYSHNPHGPGCGDHLDIALRDATTVMAGKTAIVDATRLKLIGETNGLWRETWEGLNVGMQRMNLANRMRGILRNDAEAAMDIFETISRFGVDHKPKAKKGKAAQAA